MAKPLTILLLEYNKKYYQLLKDSLEKTLPAGGRVINCRNFTEAENYVHRGLFDIVVAELAMKGESSSPARDLRALFLGSYFLVLLDSLELGRVNSALALGADDFLAVPVNHDS